MNPRPITERLLRIVPVLHIDDRLSDAGPTIVDAGVPALPVVDDRGRLHGIFGEREFIAALLPGYLNDLRFAGFVPQTLDPDLRHRKAALAEPVSRHTNRERVEVGEEHSDTQLAETFMHHRVLIAPVVDERRQVRGIVTRSDFFAALVREAGRGR